MNSASMWGRPIKVGRPTQAQPYLKTIESTVIDSKKSTCIYVSSIHEVSKKHKTVFIGEIKIEPKNDYYISEHIH